MWDKKQSEKFRTPNYSKEYIRKPAILKLIGDIKGKKILELGCGSGYWTRIFAKKGAKCLGVDIEETQLKIAIEEEKKTPLGITYLKADISNLRILKSNSFDIVFMEFVLLEIPKISIIKKIFREAYRVLKKDGILFISEMHPFDPILGGKDRYELPNGFNYFSSGSIFCSKATQLDKTTIKFRDHHWTFEDYFSCLSEAGFAITNLKEPRTPEKLIKRIPYFKYRRNSPKEIILAAKKL
jgi:ubiquinone/menaquinone biosynthesis C-methylase UbiE